MERWSFSENPFENSTDNSFRKAVKISQLHLSALDAHKSDPDILAMFESFEPLNQAMNDSYDAHWAQEGSQEGKTLNVRQNLRLLSNPKIRLWDVAIQAVYPQDSSEYKALLPQGRSPFQKGAQLMRINAVNTLTLAIGADPALQVLKGEIALFYQQLNDSYKLQQGSISSTKTLSEAVESARIAMCTGMYANLGKLMSKFAGNRSEIDNYFPLELIRNAQQVDFTNSVKPQKIRAIVKRTLTASDMVRLINDGPTVLWFYLAPSKTTQPNGQYFIAPQNSDQSVAANVLGDLANPHILAYNPETEQKGHFTLELM